MTIRSKGHFVEVLVHRGISIFLPRHVNPFRFLNVRRVIPIRFNRGSKDILQIRFFRFYRDQLVRDTSTKLKGHFRRLGRHIPPLLIDRLFHRVIYRKLLHIRYFHHFFYVLRSLNEVNMACSNISKPPLNVHGRRHKRSNSTMKFFVNFREDFYLHILLLFA